MTGRVVWAERAGERQTPLQAAAQALRAVYDALGDAKKQLEVQGFGPAIDMLRTADLPAGLLPLIIAGGDLADRIKQELTTFDDLCAHARRSEFEGGAYTTSFVGLAAELVGLGRAFAVICEACAPVLEAEAAERDRASRALAGGEAFCSFQSPHVLRNRAPGAGDA